LHFPGNGQGGTRLELRMTAMRNRILHILHIFRKDVRQHWPEIGASIAILGAYAWHESTRPTGLDYPVGWNLFLHWLPRLLALAWGFLIVRVVQGERLVGDRQFCVTRPYEWKRLLSSKMLCVLIFLLILLLFVLSILFMN